MLWICCFPFFVLDGSAIAADENLAAKVFVILESKCGGCHNATTRKGDLNVLRHSELIDGGYVVDGNLKQSDLWDRVAVSKDMPDGGPPLSAKELDAIRKWIEKGAPRFENNPGDKRRYIPLDEIFIAIRADLVQVPHAARKRIRYYSIHHLHNNPELTNADLAVFRAALSKLINSLSWNRKLHVPTTVNNTEGTILKIDLQEIGWNHNDQWRRIEERYPYGFLPYFRNNRKAAESANDIYDWTNTKLPIIRADWFVTLAAQPPLYHELLELPRGEQSDTKLEKRLGVDVDDDLRRGVVHRAGFINSNVSLHNRVVDRHEGKNTQYYWKSYDFASSTGDRDLTLKPLGPQFQDNPFPNAAFKHDGGEIIFSLPNGLQGYLIVDNEGKRLDEAPIAVVVDSERKPLNSPVVRNGISCIACHDRGMRRFRDNLRRAHGLFGDARKRVEELFPPKPVMDDFLIRDGQRFMKAVRAATKDFVEELSVEPISAISEYYVRNLTLSHVAPELGEPDLKKLTTLFKSGPSFRIVGMGPLAEGGVIKRQAWQEFGKNGYSRFHEVVELLDIGEPFRVFPDE
jgi:serine/threonine-protein kinase